MSKHETHENHAHKHGPTCGHKSIRHGAHVDYLHDGHLHAAHDDHFDECNIAVGGENPAACTPGHACGEHERAHAHGAACGHERVRHGDHVDFLVGGHLHHPHATHCDDHGRLAAV